MVCGEGFDRNMDDINIVASSRKMDRRKERRISGAQTAPNADMAASHFAKPCNAATARVPKRDLRRETEGRRTEKRARTCQNEPHTRFHPGIKGSPEAVAKCQSAANR